MTRRMILLTALPLSLAAKGRKIPTDMGRLNALAAQYNAYVELLQRDIVSIAQWERVERFWDRLGE